MSVALSMLAALAYGLSDFIGGLAARRTTPWPAAALASLGALAGALVLLAGHPVVPSGAGLAWGALAGVGAGAGGAFLYRGFAAGRMGVVAPVSAVGSALLPALVGLATGDRLGPLVWVGVLVAFPGIWLVAREPGPGGAPSGGLLDGVLAGAGFGLLFAATGQVPASDGYAPLVAGQAVSCLVVVVVAAALGASARPRARTDLWGLPAGLLAAMAVACFLAATQGGLLTVAAVVTSLYPAVTVVLAALALREPVHRAQGLGLLLSAVTVTLVAAG